MHRNNQMNWLEQHDKHTYNFESTSQIKEEKLVCFVKIHCLRIPIYHCIVIFLGQCIDTFKFCIVPSLLVRGAVSEEVIRKHSPDKPYIHFYH